MFVYIILCIYLYHDAAIAYRYEYKYRVQFKAFVQAPVRLSAFSCAKSRGFEDFFKGKIGTLVPCEGAPAHLKRGQYRDL